MSGVGAPKPRTLRLYEFRESATERRTLIRFLEPAYLRGTGVLVHTGRESSQWLFLPNGERLLQLDSAQRDARFAGSDLSYRDLALLTALPGWGLADANSKSIGNEVIDAVPCHVLDLLPKQVAGAYPIIRTWLGTNDLVSRRLEFRDASGGVLKRVQLQDIRDVNNVPLPFRIIVETSADATQTDIAVQDALVNVGLSSDCFTTDTLAHPAEDETRCAASSPASARVPPEMDETPPPAGVWACLRRFWHWIRRLVESLW